LAWNYQLMSDLSIQRYIARPMYKKLLSVEETADNMDSRLNARATFSRFGNWRNCKVIFDGVVCVCSLSHRERL